MMEVGPWRWDGKSEEDFWVKPGGWDEYTTVVYGQLSYYDGGDLSLYLMCEQKWINLQALVSHIRARIVMCTLPMLWVFFLLFLQVRVIRL